MNVSDALSEHVGELERDLGLPKGFYTKLGQDEDWSFVIKLHALIESALAHLLEHELGRPEAARFVSYLNVGGRTGKVALGLALKCVNDEQAAFIERITEIRNRCVHDVRNVSFSLKEYVATLDDGKLRQLDRALAPYIVDVLDLGGEVKLPRIELLRQHPNLAIWMAGTVFLAFVYLSAQRARLTAQSLKLAYESFQLQRSSRNDKKND